MLSRIEAKIDTVTPIEPGGFRQGISCNDQILTLTTSIESAFQRRKRVSIALVDLSSAYDTVWKQGLLMKLTNVIKCKKIVNMVENMLCDRRFRTYGRKVKPMDDPE